MTESAELARSPQLSSQLPIDLGLAHPQGDAELDDDAPLFGTDDFRMFQMKVGLSWSYLQCCVPHLGAGTAVRSGAR